MMHSIVTIKMNQQDYLYYGYRMNLKLVIRTFINTEFIDNLRDFIMETDTCYFKESEEDFSDFHKLRYFIQDYFNGDFFSLDEMVSPIHLVPVECCGDDDESDWILGIKVYSGSMDIEDPNVSLREQEMIEEIGDVCQLDIEPDFHYINMPCTNPTYLHI